MTPPPHKTLKSACETLATGDPALARAYCELGVPEWRTGSADYAALARLVTYQFLSTNAAGAIWGRVLAHCGAVTPHAIRSAKEDDLRTCGLSRPKIRHLHAIAEAVGSGTLDFERLQTASLDQARKELRAVRGIGPWTADVFLLYGGALDAFPYGDVGLMEAHKLLLRADIRMESKVFTAHAESWRPWRGVAAHLLWGWINMMRAKDSKSSPQA